MLGWVTMGQTTEYEVTIFKHVFKKLHKGPFKTEMLALFIYGFPTLYHSIIDLEKGKIYILNEPLLTFLKIKKQLISRAF